MAQTSIEDVCRVISVAQDLIQIEVLDPNELKKETSQPLTIGTYIKIADDDGLAVIAVVRAYRIKDPSSPSGQVQPGEPHFVLDAQPLGFLDSNGAFQRGGQQIAIPPTRVSIADTDTLSSIYSAIASEAAIEIGRLSRDESIVVPIDGNKFFSKHVAVVGSTGSGKSCAVAKIIQEGRRPTEGQQAKKILNNSHIIIFDLHGEYAPAFPGGRVLDVSQIKLPYWLMTAEELEEMFIESREQNSHNQISQFRHAVQANKRLHNDADVSYDSPVYFSIEEVYNFICNMNAEVIGELEGEGCPKLADGTLVKIREDHYFSQIQGFAEMSQKADKKAGRGPFRGEFDRFILRLRTTLDSPRLNFLLKPRKETGGEYKTEDMRVLIEQIIGYAPTDKANVTILDLHGVPFEVHSLVVSLLSRIIFDVGFYRKRVLAKKGAPVNRDEVAFLVVYEEAHKYVPRSESARYRSVTKAIERIAKEGRKYGICLMVVSQRPSDVSETVFSQCNSFVAMRLTNPADQAYVRALLPDALAGLTDALSTLQQREVLVVGECIPVPTLLKVADVSPTPDSRDIRVLEEWRKDWVELELEKIIETMKYS